MRKFSFVIWVVIALLLAYIQYSNLSPNNSSPSQASATIAGMAEIGVYEAIAGFVMLALFPLLTLAYLLNWQHLFASLQASSYVSSRIVGRVTKSRLLEAIVFLIPAVVVALTWLNKVYSANAFIQLLGVMGTLPLLLFGVINITNYCKLPAQSINTLRKIELVFFTLPMLCIILFFGTSFYQAQIRAKQEVTMAKQACQEAFAAMVEHQINRQKDEILQSANLQHSHYYQKLPKKSLELYLYLSDTESAYNGESYDAVKSRINQKNAAWSLHIISAIDDATPELVLNGLSDNDGFIQADLAKYPQVRKVLESGKTLRISTENGSGLLEASKINNGEVLLRAMMDTYLPKNPISSCP